MRIFREIVIACCLSLGSVNWVAALAAETYPAKPVRVIVPYPPGGGADTAARIIAQALSESMRQQFIVDNRPGATGRIGTELAAKALPDGYTLLVGNVGPNAIVPAAYSKLPYDAVKDFAPVSLVASSAYALVVHPSLPVKTLRELIALAKSQPGRLDFASTGLLGGPHLAGELFKSLAHVDLLHVAYKGGSPQMTAVLSGEVSLAFASLPTAMGLFKAGRVRVLGVTSAQRSHAAPEIPAIGEVLPGYAVSQWYGVLLPAGAPKEVVSALHQAIAQAVATPKVKEQYFKAGADATSNTPDEFAAYIKSEIDKWRKVVQSAHIPLE